MSCELVTRMRSDHVDGLLTDDEERLYRAHLVTCRECGHRHEELVALRSMLAATAPSVEPPADLPQRLAARIAADDRPRPLALLGGFLQSLLPAGGVLRSGAATAALLVLTVALLVPGGARRAGSDEALAGTTGHRQAVYTVWDSSRERIVAGYDPSGLRPCDQTDPCAVPPTPSAPAAMPPVLEASPPLTPIEAAVRVRLYLFERIDVRG